MLREGDVRELAAALRTGAVLVDVRERFEYVSGHVPGVMSLPIGELVVRGRELPASATVYVICATGNRTGCAAGLDAVSVRGGTAACIQAERPVIRGPRADVA